MIDQKESKELKLVLAYQTTVKRNEKKAKNKDQRTNNHGKKMKNKK